MTDEAGTVVKLVIPAGQPNPGTYLVAWNGHGDALNLLRLDGGTLTLANSFSYDTWGSATVYTHNGVGDLGFRYRYVGQHGVQDDAVHGLPMLLMGARHYIPRLGRFIQPDPSAQEENLYVYAGNNPVSRADPDGKFALLAGLLVVARAVVTGVRWVATNCRIKGREFVCGKSFRVAPLFNPRAKTWSGKLPHYHRRYAGPAGGIGRHRPWQGR